MTEGESKEPKPIATPGLATETLIFEQACDNTFIIYDRVTQKICSNQYVMVGIREYVPLEKIPWLLCESQPSREVCCERVGIDPAELAKTKEELKELISQMEFEGEYGTEESLYDEVRQFFEDHLDVQNELLYDVYAAFTLMTWRVDDFKVVPYLFFLGPLASGKTRALECLRYLGYRALMSATMTAAAIFRSIESWHCLLLLDESEVYNRDTMVEVLALLNAGYRKGQYAIRIERLVKDGPPELGMFDVFGPKAIAGTEELKNTLQSRAILTSMSKNVKHVPIFIDENRAQQLRNKLLMYRFRNLGSKSEFDVSVLNGFFTNARVIELFVSLLQLAPSQKVRDRLIKCMKGITQSRLDEEQASIEARVFEAILKCEDKQEQGRVTTETITQVFNDGLSENEQEKVWYIGRKVTALGFEKCRVGNKAGYFWDQKRIERLKNRYATPLKSPAEPAEPAESAEAMEKEPVQTILAAGSAGDPPAIAKALNHDNIVETAGSTGSAGSAGDLEGLASNCKSLARLTVNIQDNCCLCGSRGRQDYQVTLLDDHYGFLCGPCGIKLEKRISNRET